MINKPKSFSADEIRYLQKYAYEYGYQLDGNTWIKVSDWRGSKIERAVGGSIGPVTIISQKLR